MQLTDYRLDKILNNCRQEGDCLIWKGAKDNNGYGMITLNRKTARLHRLIYAYYNGPILDGYTIDHVKDRGCHSKACLNIKHLEAVMERVNILRSDSMSAVNARKTHCPKGHPYDIINDKGYRRCRKCRDEYNRKYWRKHHPL